MATRTESDSFGPIEVPLEHYWGAQTQRSLLYFAIGSEKMPLPVIYALATIKKASALVNRELGLLDEQRCDLIVTAADDILAGKLDAEFPLSVWQTGSGTQSNMNVNEVIAARANVLGTGKLAVKGLVHPNDHVNMSQSSNDAFPTAMHLAAVGRAEDHLRPAVAALRATLDMKAMEYADLVKI